MSTSIMDLWTKALRVVREEGIPSLIKKSTIQILKGIINTPLIGYVRVTLCKHKLKRYHAKIHGLDDTLDLAFSFKFLGIRIKPAQVKEEIYEFIGLLQKHRPKVTLEIGTANGGTLFLFSHIAPPNATLISIDLPGGPFGGGYPRWKAPLYKSFSRGRQRIYLLRADSHNPATLEKVMLILVNRKIDFLFIDGDHSYEGVKKDFEMYSPLVRKGGIIAFHDIVPGSSENVGGVPKFWGEVKHGYGYREIIKDWNQGGWGIGILYV
ncbi:MAG: class I SAM-dependent methyltransferase [Thermoproteota archaeon]